MTTYRKSTLIVLVTLITLFSLFLDVGSAEAKRRRKHRKARGPVAVQVVDQALILTLQQIQNIGPSAPAITCEPFVDKECAGDLRYKIQ